MTETTLNADAISIDEVRAAIATLAEALHARSFADDMYKAEMRTFEEKNARLIEERKAWKAIADGMDVTVRKFLLALYEADPQAYTMLDDNAVEVIQTHVAEYDSDELRAAALERAPLLLRVSEQHRADETVIAAVRERAPWALEVNDGLVQDMAKGGLPDRALTAATLGASLPELRFVHRPATRISDPKLTERGAMKAIAEAAEALIARAEQEG